MECIRWKETGRDESNQETLRSLRASILVWEPLQFYRKSPKYPTAENGTNQ